MASKVNKAETAYHIQDEAGSTLFLLDETHKIQKTYHYDAFGTVLEESGDTLNRLTYTGQQYDTATGQYYLRARFYNPALGRFLQEDVYRGDGLNLYAYCKNHPVGYYDPSGYMVCPNGKTNAGKKTPAQRAEEKGYKGIGTTSNGGADFENSIYVYIDNNGKKAIVEIEMTGSRGRDFTKAFNAANIPRHLRKSIKEQYTWHHLDDFNPQTNKCTMQLVLSDAHVATYPHKGSVAQYEKYYNVEYK